MPMNNVFDFRKRMCRNQCKFYYMMGGLSRVNVINKNVAVVSQGDAY